MNIDRSFAFNLADKLQEKWGAFMTVYPLYDMFFKHRLINMSIVGSQNNIKGQIPSFGRLPRPGGYYTIAEPGFDRDKTIVVAYPKVEVNSLLKLVMTTKTHTVPIKGFFNARYRIGGQMPERNNYIRIKSPMPLYYQVEGPDGYYSVKSEKVGKFYFTEIKQIKDAFFIVKNESMVYFAKSPYPRVYISSSREWRDIGNAFASDFENVIGGPLPGEAASQIQLIKQNKSDFVGRVNEFTAYLAQNVRYMGDWRTVDGAYKPRPFAEVFNTKYGDCKDFAAVTAKALRMFGYKAQVAAVSRGRLPAEFPPLPIITAFNHVVVRAEDENGKVFWIDPTNSNSFAQGQRNDIAGRSALVLVQGSESILDSIPGLTPDSSQLSAVATLKNQSMGVREKVFSLTFRGRMAQNFAGAESEMSKERLAEEFINMQVGGTRIISSKMDDFDLKSRIVEDKKFSGTVTYIHASPMTSSGRSQNLDGQMKELQTLDVNKRVSDIFVTGVIQVEDSVMVLKDARFIGKNPLKYELKSKWFDLERNITQDGDDIVVKEKTVYYRHYILLSEIRSDEFKRMRTQLRKEFTDFSIIYEPIVPLVDVDIDEIESGSRLINAH